MYLHVQLQILRGVHVVTDNLLMIILLCSEQWTDG